MCDSPNYIVGTNLGAKDFDKPGHPEEGEKVTKPFVIKWKTNFVGW